VRRLRIAEIAPVASAVTPTSTGSIEQIVHLLTEELVARGHDVTLYATGDSETSARLKARYERGYNHDPGLWDWMFHEFVNAAAAFERAGDFDVIHTHTYHYALPFTRLVATPVLHTYHVLPDEDIVQAYARYPEANVVSISAFQRSQLDGAGERMPVVHHGIDFDRFPFGDVADDFLLFLGRLSWAKGPLEAIHFARAAQMRLVIAGPADDEGYARQWVEPHLDSADVEYLGWVDQRKRNKLLARASALVYPINHPETFGLVMVEAMACGTPALALDRGAVSEIVDDGVTGFARPELEELVAAVPAAVSLDRATVRRRARERFNHRRMTDEYEHLYRTLVSTRGRT
jgi:glycosyltransferase involved in cell wall biosynthesis